ncbi:MAG: GNAT family N-acetyltransferase [Anaerolineales bacterium]
MTSRAHGKVGSGPDTLVIRHAVREDAATLALLAGRTFRDAYAAQSDLDELDDYVAEHFTAELLAQQIQDSSTLHLLASVAGVPIGYAVLRLGTPPDCVRGPRPIELGRLYLEQSVIGKGYGAALMRSCLGEADRLGCETMWLGVWEENHRARAFYKKWGFQDMGTYEFEIGGKVDHDPVMGRPVKSSA